MKLKHIAFIGACLLMPGITVANTFMENVTSDPMALVLMCICVIISLLLLVLMAKEEGPTLRKEIEKRKISDFVVPALALVTPNLTVMLAGYPVYNDTSGMVLLLIIGAIGVIQIVMLSHSEPIKDTRELINIVLAPYRKLHILKFAI